MTPEQEKRLTSELSFYAGEDVRTEQINATFYAYGSEIAVLRIFAKYLSNGAVASDKYRIGYSTIEKCFFFAIHN